MINDRASLLNRPFFHVAPILFLSIKGSLCRVEPGVWGLLSVLSSFHGSGGKRGGDKVDLLPKTRKHRCPYSRDWTRIDKHHAVQRWIWYNSTHNSSKLILPIAKICGKGESSKNNATLLQHNHPVSDILRWVGIRYPESLWWSRVAEEAAESFRRARTKMYQRLFDKSLGLQCWKYSW